MALVACRIGHLAGDECLGRGAPPQLTGLGDRTEWIPGPITTVRDGQACLDASAATNVRIVPRRWFTERSGVDMVVLGNHPMSVRCIEAARALGRIWTTQTFGGH